MTCCQTKHRRFVLVVRVPCNGKVCLCEQGQQSMLSAITDMLNCRSSTFAVCKLETHDDGHVACAYVYFKQPTTAQTLHRQLTGSKNSILCVVQGTQATHLDALASILHKKSAEVYFWGKFSPQSKLTKGFLAEYTTFFQDKYGQDVGWDVEQGSNHERQGKTSTPMREKTRPPTFEVFSTTSPQLVSPESHGDDEYGAIMQTAITAPDNRSVPAISRAYVDSGCASRRHDENITKCHTLVEDWLDSMDTVSEKTVNFSPSRGQDHMITARQNQQEVSIDLVVVQLYKTPILYIITHWSMYTCQPVVDSDSCGVVKPI